MHRHFLTALFCLHLLPATVLGGIQGEMHIRGSAIAKHGKQGMVAQIFSQGNKYRMDLELPGTQAGRMSYISDGDAKKRFSLMHRRKVYMDLPPGLGDEQANFFMQGATRNIEKAREEGYTVKEIAKETLQGFACTVYQIEGRSKHELRRGKAWFADTLGGFMIKMKGTSKDGSTFEMALKNIKKKKLSPTMFQVPKGYKAFSPPNMGALGQNEVMKKMQALQNLPPEQRAKALQAFREQMEQQAEQLRRQYQP